MSQQWIAVLGSFVADLTFRTRKAPNWGETILGTDFKLGPGGKGSNQAVAAARLGGHVSFISKLGNDPFGDLARQTYKAEGIDTRFLFATSEHQTGGASILVDEVSGENAIIVFPGACYQLTSAEVDQASGLIAESAVFLAQLEVQLASVRRGLELAHELKVTTVLNPAPAAALSDDVIALCDYLSPNESEASILTGLPVRTIEQADRAAAALLRRGARNVVVTLGARGALVKNHSLARHVPAVKAGPVVETTGAGDAFAGGFVVALAEGRDLLNSVQFGCAVAGISVTRHGTAPSMPRRAEVDALLAGRR